jgi:hypothetical protein
VQTVNLVLIPYWIRDGIVREGLPYKTVLDPIKLRTLFSASDLAQFIAVNNRAEKVLGIDTWKSLPGIWSDKKVSAEVDDFYRTTIIPLSTTPETIQEINTRLFDTTTKREGENEYITYDLERDSVGVVLSRGFDTSNSNSNVIFGMIESILKVLYVYNPQHEVAKTQYFKRYLDLLSLK